MMRNAKIYRYQLPMNAGVILRHRPLTQREGLIIHLTENGKEGWGEIAPLPYFSQESLLQAETQLRHWLAKWLTEPLQNGKNCEQNNRLSCQLYTLDRLLPSVAFGVSCALAELENSLNEQGEFRTTPLCQSNDHSPEALYDRLQQNGNNNEKIAKMKVGLNSPQQDGKLAERFLHAIPELQLRLDANRMWSIEHVREFARQISPKNRPRIQFIEEPCQTPLLSCQFAQENQIAIAWDETVREPYFEVKKQPYVTAIVLKPTLIGSISHCISLIKQAHQQGMLAVISSSLESSLGLTQLARLAYQYTPNTLSGLDTLNTMQTQLLRRWENSTLPLADLNSPFITRLSL